MDFLGLMLMPLIYWELLLGGIAIFFFLGWLWYNPITPIGKVWVHYFPMPKKMPPKSQMGIMILFQIFLGLVLAHTTMILWLYATGNDMTDTQATLLVVKMYMGFVFIKDLGHWYFEQKPFALVLLGVGYYLVGVLGVCAMLSYFL